jgi:hypothetical protein
MTSLYGGYGQAAHGRSQYGSPSPSNVLVIEPRFNISKPVDGARNVNPAVWATFDVYYYTCSYPKPVEHAHWGLVPTIKVELSLDGGQNYLTVFDPETMVADAPGYTTRVRYRGGQRIWAIIKKLTGWPLQGEVKIRYTGPDEYGQAATKEVPIHWS